MVALWLFIFAVAGYDTYFAWQHQASFSDWELNPLARTGAALFGLGVVFGYKFMALVFAAGMAWYCRRRRPQLSRATTLILASAHSFLLLAYIAPHALPDLAEDDEHGLLAARPAPFWTGAADTRAGSIDVALRHQRWTGARSAGHNNDGQSLPFHRRPGHWVAVPNPAIPAERPIVQAP